MKLRLTLIECGTCGKPRGLRHTCVSTRRKQRARLRPGLGLTCGKCGHRMRNPLTHTCTVRTDFRKRRARAERHARVQALRERKRKRRAEVTARRRERRRRQRAEAAARRKAAARERRAKAATAARKPRAPTHNPRTCRDGECQRYPCRMYREGFEDGVAAGSGAAAGGGE